MNLKVNRREGLYFVLRVIFSFFGLFLFAFSLMGFAGLNGAGGGAMGFAVIFYVLIFVLYFKILHIFMIGHLKGNGVQITENQFPEVYKMIQEVAGIYNMKQIPPVFLIQSGGILNAYATRLAGKNYIAIYSEVFSILSVEPDVLKFVLAHEMAHVKRNHMQKRFWTFFSFWVPFLGSAYSRSCEYTCDNFGNAAAPQGSKNGLVVLAAGRDLYQKVNIDQYLSDAQKNNSFSVKFAGIFSGHPHLPKRIQNLNR